MKKTKPPRHKISSLIKALLSAQKRYGDIPVGTLDWDQYLDGYFVGVRTYIVYDTDKDNKVVALNLVDYETSLCSDPL